MKGTKSSHNLGPRERDSSIDGPKYRLTVEHRHNYTYACIQSADVNFKPAAKHISKILERCGGVDCERLIIENRTCTAFHRGDFMQTATQFPGFGSVHTRVAIVDVWDSRREGEGLYIVVGQESSIKVRVFATVVEAENWLGAH